VGAETGARGAQEKVKTIRDKSGTFQERPHFEPAEIDQICADELRKAGCYPAQAEPIRIDRFIEKRFHITHTYEVLPPGVLGYTKFGKNGVERIVVSSALAEEDDDVARRRERSTLAHEAGHGLLHAYLFALSAPQTSLFGTQNGSANQVLCREVLNEQPVEREKSSWSEYQANRAIGGLLLPQRLVSAVLKSHISSQGTMGVSTIDAANRKDAERLLSQVFDVNPVVARIRIDGMFGAADAPQLSL
jgi:hypothetical protein